MLDTKAWKTFAGNMKKAADLAQDDLDLVFAFHTHAKKLPFSHKLFYRTEQANAGAAQIKSRFDFLANQVVLEEKSPETVVLRIKSFRCPGRDVDSAMQIVLAKNYQNLIVDIRGNPGGALEGGMTLAQYLVREENADGGLPHPKVVQRASRAALRRRDERHACICQTGCAGISARTGLPGVCGIESAARAASFRGQSLFAYRPPFGQCIGAFGLEPEKFGSRDGGRRAYRRANAQRLQLPDPKRVPCRAAERRLLHPRRQCSMRWACSPT